MQVSFRTRKLERCFLDADRAIREWGPQVGRRYVQRIDTLLEAERRSNVQAVRAFGLHPLSGRRDGQHALRLTGQVRLILTFESETSIIVEEVTDYHD